MGALSTTASGSTTSARETGNPAQSGPLKAGKSMQTDPYARQNIIDHVRIVYGIKESQATLLMLEGASIPDSQKVKNTAGIDVTTKCAQILLKAAGRNPDNPQLTESEDHALYKVMMGETSANGVAVRKQACGEDVNLEVDDKDERDEEFGEDVWNQVLSPVTCTPATAGLATPAAPVPVTPVPIAPVPAAPVLAAVGVAAVGPGIAPAGMVYRCRLCPKARAHRKELLRHYRDDHGEPAGAANVAWHYMPS